MKGVALLAMILDHSGKIVLWWWMEPLHSVGRLALPLFSVIVALRLSVEGGLWRRYLLRLLPWGLLAQPAYAAVADEPLWRLNILFTLAAGIAVDAMLHQRDRSVLPGIAAVLVSPLCEFGPLGVLSIPALAWWGRRAPWLAVIACGPLALLANFNADPHVMRLNTAALLATPIAALLWAAPPTLPRPPRRFYYAFYAAHLYALWGWYVWVI